MILDEKEAVIFDLDGSLVDSMWIWKQIDIDYLGRFGHELPPTLQDEIGGMSFYETAVYIKKRFDLPCELEDMMQDWNDMAREKYMNEVPLKEGVFEFLQECKKRNIKLGIASSNSRELVNGVLETLGVFDYFDYTLTGSEAKRGKPAPDIYLAVAKELSVNPENCLVFEDIVPGIMAGKSAGMTVIAVEDDHSKYQEQEKIELADGFIRNYYELLK